MAVADNGHAALSLLATQPFDLVLMDIQMPRWMDLRRPGKFARTSESTHCHLPIVAMTAHAMKGDRELCIEAGMDEYVSKPISSQRLEEAIATLCRTRQNTLTIQLTTQRRSMPRRPV